MDIGPPAGNLEVTTNVGTTDITLELASDQAESFLASCLPNRSSYHATNIMIVTSLVHTNVLQGPTNYTLLVTGLQEYTHYTCSITPRNIFGEGPTANISMLTNPAGIGTPKVTDKL